MSFQFFEKRKLLVDNIVVGIIIIVLAVWAFSSPLLIIMSAVVYPMSCLFIYGLMKTYQSLRDIELKGISKVLLLILGVVSIIFSGYILILVFSQPPIPLSFILYFFSLPVFLIGIAGLLKGLIVTVYSPRHRKINITIGVVTSVAIWFAVLTTETLFIFNLFLLTGLLILNGLFRSALYLSEYGLVLNSVKNLKLSLIIMDSTGIPQRESDSR
jgi:hypothetical protein